MPDAFKITCPECGKKFDPGSAIDNHIKNVSKQKEEKIRRESESKFKSQIEAKDKEIEKSKKLLSNNKEMEIRGKTAFFAPLILTSPKSGLPPCIINLSLLII